MFMSDNMEMIEYKRIFNTHDGELYHKMVNRSYSAYYEPWTGLTLTNTSSSDGNFNVVTGSSVTSVPNLEYSLDGGYTWTTATLTAGTTTSVPVSSGKSVCLRGVNTSGFNKSDTNITQFNMDSAYNVSGNIMSLVDYKNMDTITTVPNYCFISLFESDTNVIDANGINVGNVTTVGDCGFNKTFHLCSNLTRGFDLNTITTLGSDSFRATYNECYALTYSGDFSSVTNYGTRSMYAIYYKCYALQEGIKFNDNVVVGTRAFIAMYRYCYNLPTVYAPNVTSWNTTIFNFWIEDACSSVTGDKIMYAPNQTVANLIPSGTSGYGEYAVKVIE